MIITGQPARVLSDTISKSLKKVSKKSAQCDLDNSRSAIDNSPFVQYGAGNDEEETGYKRTHNVLSRHGVSDYRLIPSSTLPLTSN